MKIIVKAFILAFVNMLSHYLASVKSVRDFHRAFQAKIQLTHTVIRP